ncbi:phosphatidylinositol 3-kinase, root isoform isoform X1 [Histomonas meleagridis]|uniref:phosphatidylinositol 3-kinase, root isoform isoform X1 n=1 Tax=Histomonas meleagridis TaxID=135588 RepID=UPI00355A5007|nr:phosphatidylinositol 3-kinase, root isoform isoform X1 [Histomonas meleagridis]KAH0801714.1 phosphatidylinositol 3-kinase, root isoform isoform X1 [Histomonas meleagridis]
MLGSTIHEYIVSPFDFQQSSSQFHQILLFDFTIDYPKALISRPEFSITIELLHSIPGIPSQTISVGTCSSISDEHIFPLYCSTSTDSSGAVMCDLMRFYLPHILPPFPRIPSPSFTNTYSNSNDVFPKERTTSNESSTFHGDIISLSESVTDTFSALLKGSFDCYSCPNSKINVHHTRLFKSVVMPPYPRINQLKSIIHRPIIDFSNSSPDERELLKRYKEFTSKYPSGLLKLLYMDVELNSFSTKLTLPITLALFLLSPSRVKKTPQNIIDRYVMTSLTKASHDEVLNLASFIVEQSIPSQSAFDFMVQTSLNDPEFAVAAYWAFHVESDKSKRENDVKRIYHKWKTYPGCEPLFKELHNGKKQIMLLKEIINGVKSINGKENKLNYVRSSLSNITFERPFRLPLCPSFVVEKVSIDNIIVFGSSLQPIKLDFLDKNGNVYSAILKVGDDMRQDALALTTIRFIDENLKRFNIDMYLTPYSVVPISREFGLCEFVVGAKAISKVLEQTNGNLEEFFDQENKEECRDRFIKSSAAYTVISYVLGVGDRHLDNLLMTSNGNFFHVDYGYLFGQDPKPLPCAVRVIPEMIAAFDSKEDKQTIGYTKFLRYCAVVYNAIRRKADEICCLIALMREAELPHLPNEDTKIAAILLDRLHLDLTEKQAGKLIVNEVDKSVAALFPKIFEWLHQAKMNFS